MQAVIERMLQTEYPRQGFHEPTNAVKNGVCAASVP
jgi:hypothetical protein